MQHKLNRIAPGNTFGSNMKAEASGWAGVDLVSCCVRVFAVCSQQGGMAQRQRVTPDQKVGSSNLSALMFGPASYAQRLRQKDGESASKITDTYEYTWPGSNWRPSACEADVIATRPQVP